MKSKQFLKNILLVFWGFLVFSPDYVNFPSPFNSFELLTIAFLFINRKELNLDKKDWSNSLIYYFIFLILAIIGIVILDANGAYEYYRITRQWFLMITFAYLFFKSPLINEINLYYLTLGSTLGSLAMAVAGIGVLVDNETAYLCPNIVAIPICVFFSLRRNSLLKISTFVIVFAMGALSQTRGILIYCFLSYLLSYIVQTHISYRTFFNKNILLIAVGFILVYFAYIKLEDTVAETSSYLHYRLYDKVQNAGETSEDVARINAYNYYLDNFIDYILPHGFYLRRGEAEWGRKNYPGVNDSGYLELVHTFGWFLLYIIFFYIYKNIKRMLPKLDPDHPIITCLFTTTLFLLFALLMGYAIFMAPYSAAMWGIYFALLRTYNNQENTYYAEI